MILCSLVLPFFGDLFWSLMLIVCEPSMLPMSGFIHSLSWLVQVSSARFHISCWLGAEHTVSICSMLSTSPGQCVQFTLNFFSGSLLCCHASPVQYVLWIVIQKKNSWFSERSLF